MTTTKVPIDPPTVSAVIDQTGHAYVRVRINGQQYRCTPLDAHQFADDLAETADVVIFAEETCATRDAIR